MKRNYFLTLLCTLLSVASFAAEQLPNGYPESDRTKVSLNADWRFRLGDEEANYFATSTNDSAWELVSVPHTLKLTDIGLDGCKDEVTQPTFHRTVGWYRKDIFVSKSNKKVYIEFEGVHQTTTLWVNGRKVGLHSVGGYTPFNMDITDFVKRGAKNQITILADNRMDETTPPDPDKKDYVMFGGIYRDLYLVEKSPVHITSNLESKQSGVTITTPSVDPVNGNATICITTEVHNESRKSSDMMVVQRVVDARGNVVLKMSESFTLAAGERHLTSHSGGISEDVKFWSIEQPYLYKVNTTLLDSDGRVVDVVDNRLGLRKIVLDPERGLLLNGKPTVLVGFNRHQNYGFIGDAAPNSLHYRDMLQLKRLGINAVRTAHYPQDDELIRACDELGMLLYEEAPTWHGISKVEGWYDNLHKAARAMIRNHKNSPSIFAWGAGINHRGVVGEMQFLVKEEDPTRLTGSQNSRWTSWQTSGWSDIYANMNYAASIWEREEPQMAMEGNGGPAALAPYFRETKRIGMLSWASAAYYTFSPDVRVEGDRTHHSGFYDVFRYPRKAELQWYPTEMRLKPYIYVKDAWQKDLKMLTIYSNATEIELKVNGVSQGRFYPSNALKYNGLTHAPFEITDFKYQEAELEVIGYREGEQMASQRIQPLGKAAALRLYADELGIEMRADGNDIVIVHAEVVDLGGNVIRDFDGEVEFSVTGDATVVGAELGKGFNPSKVRVGGASALIRAGKSTGEIKVVASCFGLRSDQIMLESKPYTTDIIAQESYPIYDTERLVVDMGSDSQLNQFGWTPWESSDKLSSEITMRPVVLGNYVGGHTPEGSNRSEEVAKGTKGGYEFKVAPITKDGLLNWVGGASAIGKNNNVFSDGVFCYDAEGLRLTMSKLPAGEYEIRSYHHAPIVPKANLKANLPAELKSSDADKFIFSPIISVWVDGDEEVRDVKVSSGNILQYEDVTTAEATFRVEKSGRAEITFKGKGVWLNGFELIRKL